MSYPWRCLKFNSEDRIPGYDVDILMANNPAIIPQAVADSVNFEVWHLMFSYAGGAFYTRTDQVPGQDGVLIKSWYAKGGNGHHSLSLKPFIVREDGSGEFLQGVDFVDFSESTSGNYWVDTDTMPGDSVTASVHLEIPELKRVEVATRATSHAVIITTTTTTVAFDQIFVYLGSAVPVGNEITEFKGQTTFALAVFKEVKTVSSKKISTYQWPKIKWYEWPMIVEKIVERVFEAGNGEIIEYLDARTIMQSDAEEVRKAVSSIRKRVTELGKVQTVVSGLVEKKKR